jgi:hypothetical protein
VSFIGRFLKRIENPPLTSEGGEYIAKDGVPKGKAVATSAHVCQAVPEALKGEGLALEEAGK